MLHRLDQSALLAAWRRMGRLVHDLWIAQPRAYLSSQGSVQSKKLMQEDVALWKEQTQRLHEACEKVERAAEHWTVLGTQAAAATEALKALERTAQTTLRSNHRRHWWSPWRNR